MSTNVVANEATRLTLDLLETWFTGEAAQRVGVRLWDGTCWPDETPRPAVLVLKHPGALRAMFLPGTEVGLGEAYLYDDFDIEGNAESVFGLADVLTSGLSDRRKRLHVASELARLPGGKRRQLSRRGSVQ